MHSRRHATLVRLTLALIFGLTAVLSLGITGLKPAQTVLAHGISLQFPTPQQTPTPTCRFPGVPPCPTFTASPTTAATSTKTERPGFETPVASPSATAGPDLTSTQSNTPTRSPIPGATFTPTITPTSSPSPTPTPQLAIIPRFAAAVEQLIPAEYVWVYLLVALTAMAALGAGIWYLVTRKK